MYFVMYREPTRRRIDSLRLSAVLIVCMCLCGFAYAISLLQQRQAQARYEKASQLVDELRHSSDDLTRMAWLYSMTREPRYRDWHQSILDIRDGKTVRPHGLGRLYWQLALDEKWPAPLGATAAALLDLVRAGEFSDYELSRFEDSIQASDRLAVFERNVMRSAVQSHDPSNGCQAAASLVAADYLRAKMAVLGPARDFIESVELSTKASMRRGALFGSVALVLMTGLACWLIYAMRGATLELAKQRREARMLEAAFTRAPWGMAILGSTGLRIVKANKALANLHGYGSEELEGMELCQLCMLEHRQHLAVELAAALQEGRRQFESMNMTKDGNCVPVRIRIETIGDPSRSDSLLIASFAPAPDRQSIGAGDWLGWTAIFSPAS